MIVAAMLDAGLDIDELKQQLATLDIIGLDVNAEETKRAGLRALKFTVDFPEQKHHRNLEQITGIIEQSKITESAKKTAIAIFEKLAKAEAAVHGKDINQIHFHEVGAVDSIVDIVSAAIGLDFLRKADQIKDKLAKTSIRAPFSGYITAKRTEVGQWITVGGTCFDLINIETVLIRVNVPESTISYVKPSDPAGIRIDALDIDVTGKVVHIIPRGDPAARTFPVEIEVINKTGRLKAGMFARAKLPAGPEIQPLMVTKRWIGGNGHPVDWEIIGAYEPICCNRPVLLAGEPKVDRWGSGAMIDPVDNLRLRARAA